MSLVYRGTSSDDVKFNVTERRVYNAPAFDVTGIEVPGRSGDILNSQERFKNKAIVYTGFIRSSDFPGDTTWGRLSRGLRTIKAWICGDAGKYHDLTDDYDPGFVRRAFVSGETAISEVLDRPDGATITITFMAEPFMYEESDPIELPETGTASGAIASFEGVAAPLQSLKFYIEPSQSGSGDPSPTNIRPISGWSQVDAWNDPSHGGTIRWNQLVQNGNFANGTTGWSNLSSENKVAFSAANNVGKLTIVDATYGGRPTLNPLSIAAPVLNHKYLLSGGVKVTTSASNTIDFSILYGKNNLIFNNASLTRNAWNDFAKVVTLTETTYAGGTLYISALASTFAANSTIEYRNIQIIDLTEMFGAGNEPTAEEFKALFPNAYYDYNAGENTCVSAVNGDPYTPIPIALGQTVYGGTLDVVRGKLVMDRGYVTITSFASKSGSTANMVYAYQGIKSTVQKPSADSVVVDLLSDKFVKSNFGSTGGLYGTDKLGIAVNTNGTVYVGFGKNGVSTLADANTWVAANPIQVVYPLATPIEVDLTPMSVSSLLGQNNIWCNTGETEVVYVEATENPTEWPSEPRLEITMAGAGTLTVNGKTWSIGAYTGTLICDSEIMDWYDASNLKNSLVSGDGFPELQPGENVITYTGGITKVVAKPRWRTL